MKKAKRSFNKSPRPYLSYTQLRTIETSEKSYIDSYFRNKKITSEAMELGTKIDEALNDPDNEHPEWNISFLQKIFPRFPEMQKKLEVNFGDVSLLGIIDGFDRSEKTIADNKAMAKFTQKMADESDQLTFYCLLAHLKFKVKPENWNLQINWAPTQRNSDGELQPTGEMYIFKTKRTMKDILQMGSRAIKARNKINILTEKILNFKIKL